MQDRYVGDIGDYARHRDVWFRDSVESLKGCDIVFADPDNGLRESRNFRPGQCRSGKSICEDEALALAANERPVVVYHHSTRFQGGIDREVAHWQEKLGSETCAVVWRHRSPRIFFILNCTRELRQRAEEWCGRWKLQEKVYFEGYPDRAID